MHRRGFLQCITFSALAAVLPWRDMPGWRVDGQAILPGARLRVHVAGHVPIGASLELEVWHQRTDGTEIPAHRATHGVTAGEHLDLVTPYPYDDLIAGTYVVRLILRDAAGQTQEHHNAGQYVVRRFRFSA